MWFEHQLKPIYIIRKTHSIGAMLKRETVLGYFIFPSPNSEMDIWTTLLDFCEMGLPRKPGIPLWCFFADCELVHLRSNYTSWQQFVKLGGPSSRPLMGVTSCLCWQVPGPFLCSLPAGPSTAGHLLLLLTPLPSPLSLPVSTGRSCRISQVAQFWMNT